MNGSPQHIAALNATVNTRRKAIRAIDKTMTELVAQKTRETTRIDRAKARRKVAATLWTAETRAESDKKRKARDKRAMLASTATDAVCVIYFDTFYRDTNKAHIVQRGKGQILGTIDAVPICGARSMAVGVEYLAINMQASRGSLATSLGYLRNTRRRLAGCRASACEKCLTEARSRLTSGGVA